MKRLATLLGLLPLASCGALTTDSVELDEVAARQSFYALETQDLDGAPVELAAYAGQVSLVVNTASQCGYTSQYAGLEELQQDYASRGFTVLAFPSGDFGGQEFDDAAEIRAFCEDSYSVSFPLLAKSGVKAGAGQSPVFAFLGRATGSLPGWNFGKYLVARDGRVLAFFPTPVAPTSDELRRAIENALEAEG